MGKGSRALDCDLDYHKLSVLADEVQLDISSYFLRLNKQLIVDIVTERFSSCMLFAS